MQARTTLLEAWREKKSDHAQLVDPYLDELLLVQQEGYLGEYVGYHLRQRSWTVPGTLRLRTYRRWLADTLPGHKPETRLIGTWNYKERVASP